MIKFRPRTKTIDTTRAFKKEKMLGEHNGYHQSITGDEAEQRLKECGEDCYLTRYSEAQQCYVLSVCKQQTPTNIIKHFKIVLGGCGKCKIDGSDETFFDNIENLLSHYMEERIDPAIDKIGRPYTEEEFMEKREQMDERWHAKEERRQPKVKRKTKAEKTRLVAIEEKSEKISDERKLDENFEVNITLNIFHIINIYIPLSVTV